MHGAIEDPDAVADAVAGRRGDRQLRGRDARRPLDQRTRGVHRHQHAGHARAARGGPSSTACATSRSRPTRSTARSTSGSFTETSPLAPSSPYSATKTGADLLVQSYFHTYGLPTLICRGSNNYGPHQYPEKLIPLMILNALAGDHLPVTGTAARAQLALRRGLRARDRPRPRARRAGEVYNCGGPDECENLRSCSGSWS